MDEDERRRRSCQEVICHGGGERQKKTGAGCAGQVDALSTNLKFKIADAIVFKKIREKLGGRLKGSMTGSAMMNPEISHFFWDMGIPLYDAYGLTETSPGATMNRPTKYKIGSVGPIMGLGKIVIDKSVSGRMQRRGDHHLWTNVMQGYQNNRSHTRPS